MKNLMRILSMLLAIVALLIIIGEAFDTGKDYLEFSKKLYSVVSNSLLPLISIAICCYCLERNDENYLVRVIPIYMIVPIVLSFIIIMFEVDAEWLIKFYLFLSGTFVGVTVLSVVLLIRANNKISTILKYISIGIIVANVVLTIYAQIKVYLFNTLPNVYGYHNYGGFNFSTLDQTSKFITKAYNVTTIGQLFTLLLLFMTNYAFSDKIELETEDIDYEAIKQDALNAANMQMQQKYNPKPQETQPDRSASSRGLMNINNQLGQNSNVGNVKEKAKTMNVSGSSLESLIPLSSGPIINNTVPAGQEAQQQQQQAAEQNVQQQSMEQPAPPPMQPNLDIQEQMRLRMQNQQNNNQKMQ